MQDPQREWQASRTRDSARRYERSNSGAAAKCGGPFSGCFEAEGSVTRDYWVYVGEGKGGYDKVETFNYVGQKSGSFEVEEVTYHGGMLRWIALIAAALVLLGVCTGISSKVTIGPGQASHLASDKAPTVVQTPNPLEASTSSKPILVASASTASPTDAPPQTTQYSCVPTVDPATWPALQQIWCCQHAGFGCPASPAVATTRPPHDCNLGFANWQVGWTLTKKDYCCRHFKRACPQHLSSEAAAAASPVAVVNQAAAVASSVAVVPQAAAVVSPVAVVPQASTAAPSPLVDGCESVCLYRKQSASCKARILWAASHAYREKADACVAAHIRVTREDCPVCASCSIEESGCRATTTTQRSVLVPQAPPIAPIAPPQLPATQVAATQATVPVVQSQSVGVAPNASVSPAVQAWGQGTTPPPNSGRFVPYRAGFR